MMRATSFFSESSVSDDGVRVVDADPVLRDIESRSCLWLSERMSGSEFARFMSWPRERRIGFLLDVLSEMDAGSVDPAVVSSVSLAALAA